MIDWTEIANGDSWELFARDFLAALGFVIEVEPGRGPDRGRDLVISEQLRGKIRAQKLVWLVSCKHHAASGKAVGIEESDITDRLKRNNAAGFVGFYSTMASAPLVDRLNELRTAGDIKEYEIFDAR